MEKSIIELFLPEGILEYFDVTSVEKTEESYTISLEEKNLYPVEFVGQKLSSKSPRPGDILKQSQSVIFPYEVKPVI